VSRAPSLQRFFCELTPPKQTGLSLHHTVSLSPTSGSPHSSVLCPRMEKNLQVGQSRIGPRLVLTWTGKSLISQLPKIVDLALTTSSHSFSHSPGGERKARPETGRLHLELGQLNSQWCLAIDSLLAGT
jgi:hypothetical protein